MKNFLCKEMEELHDTTIPDFRNRRDVDRAPGGDSSTYRGYCIGCHAGMDALAGAFAYYDFVDRVVQYKDGIVVKKMNHNSLFPDGFITQSDSWVNLWSQGKNAALGWSTKVTEGNGARSFGKMLTGTEEFSRCMAKQVFMKTCFKDKEHFTESDKFKIELFSKKFRKNKFNMKQLLLIWP